VVARANLKGPEDAEGDRSGKDIELGSLVAGLTGWGLASPRPSNSQSLLNREGFSELDRGSKLRRFRRWRNGAFENFLKSFGSQTDNSVLPVKNSADLN
jgi:hypothetical protein